MVGLGCKAFTLPRYSHSSIKVNLSPFPVSINVFDVIFIPLHYVCFSWNLMLGFVGHMTPRLYPSSSMPSLFHLLVDFNLNTRHLFIQLPCLGFYSTFPYENSQEVTCHGTIGSLSTSFGFGSWTQFICKRFTCKINSMTLLENSFPCFCNSWVGIHSILLKEWMEAVSHDFELSNS